MLLFDDTNKLEVSADHAKHQQKRAVFVTAIAGLLLALSPAIVHAHAGGGETSGFTHGLTHPIHGIDHLLAMLAVGLWSAQQKRSSAATWLLPAMFVSFMVLGSVAAIGSIQLPAIETMIALSVLILGLLIAVAVQLPVAMSLPMIGFFAFYHGHAHGSEMPVTAMGLAYMSGMVLMTSTLHLAGLGIGLGTAGHVQKMRSKAESCLDWSRLSGTAIGLCGLGLILVK